MEKLSGIVYGLVSLVVIILLVVTVAIPVVDDAQSEQKTIMQNTAEKYTVISASEDVTLNIDPQNNYRATINDVSLEEYVPGPYTDNQRCYVIWDKGFASSTYSADSEKWLYWHYAFDNLPAGIDGGVMIFSDGEGTLTVDAENIYSTTYDWLMIPTEDGEIGAWPSSSLPIYVDSTSTIYLMYRYANNGLVASGTIDDLDVSFYAVSGVLSDTTITAVYEDAFYITNELTGFDKTISYVYAPIDYTIRDDNQNMIYTLLSIIPILLMIIPVIFVARLITNGRD